MLRLIVWFGFLGVQQDGQDVPAFAYQARQNLDKLLTPIKQGRAVFVVQPELLQPVVDPVYAFVTVYPANLQREVDVAANSPPRQQGISVVLKDVADGQWLWGVVISNDNPRIRRKQIREDV